ncbi:MAG: tRNA lysidine(34) synthetase TilS [Candidatus Margulisbacteria bacterium]|nr:tRNA lysidine(34) synthetase TilS [Candidatus Margulisiibacteriota bacterium]
MIKEKFLDTIKEFKMFNPEDRVLVAVSGGADSTALVHLLAEVKDELGLSLHIAHLNHMIRKNDAELDMRFVQGLAQKLGIPITVESFDVQSYAKEEKMGLEEAARRIRYAFFERVSNQIGAQKIAVGHSADDNVETFLMRILRGAGLKGLCGIPPKRGRIVRPQIKIWRREIEVYVDGLKLVPRRDYTNYESKYMRNRVRLKLIPQLKIYNMNIKEIILQTILLLTEDREYIDSVTEEAVAEAFLSSTESELKLEIEEISAWEYPLQGHIIRKAIERIKGNLLDLTYTHVQDILEKLESNERWELHLPGGIFVVGNGRVLTISQEQPLKKEKKSFFYTLGVPGEIEVKEVGKKIKVTEVEGAEVSDDPKVAFVDYAALGKNLIIRNRGEGDRFIPLGMKGSKKLQDFFVDQKIPAEFRDYIPIIESAGRIVWVAGLRLDDRSKTTKKTKKFVKLELL